MTKATTPRSGGRARELIDLPQEAKTETAPSLQTGTEININKNATAYEVDRLLDGMKAFVNCFSENQGFVLTLSLKEATADDTAEGK
ncbi:hypothetical protein [Bacillus sp. CGMCC 1.16541]|uniref:hypothetical protein n=1 Tax=Bacillus sp. CGMCC 1.16541 TaxID=2185143 RepID=UPI000D73EC64|nr:hypothetical protein [Bacillus sp. CGMCC 1.16541]